MTHLTDKEIAERFLAGESVDDIVLAYQRVDTPVGELEDSILAVEAALRRVMLADSKRKEKK